MGKFGQLRLMLLAFSFVAASFAYADEGVGQTIQISTYFHSVQGKPTWLLILRDVDSGRVLPYVYDIRNNDNFWIALSWERNYRITVSKVSWGPFATINNFCHLEDGVISGKSMIVRLRGDLTPVRNTAKCDVLEYKGLPYPIVNSSGE